jgi:DNA-3-methyladenine glycosylase I
VTKARPDVERCPWAESDPLLARYHDTEWGVPSHDERHLFELLTLEGAQAGLSWLVVLRKREGYRAAFDGFDPARVARFRPAKIERLLRDPGVVRHRGKLESVVTNARAILAMRREGSPLAEELWRHVGGKPIRKRRRAIGDVPAKTPESVEMSRALSRRGFRFVGPTICYALMQAAGLVDDHVTGCFRRGAITSPTSSGSTRGAGTRRRSGGA